MRVNGISYHYRMAKNGTWRGYRRFLEEKRDFNLSTKEKLVTAFQNDAESLVGARLEGKLNRHEWDDYRGAVTKLMPFGISLSEAVDFYLHGNAGITAKKTVNEVCEACLVAKAKRDPKYFSEFKRVCGYLQDRFNGRSIASVTVEELHQWLLKWSGVTRNNNRTTAVMVWRFARSMSWLPEGRTAPEKVGREKDNEEEVTVASPSMLKKLLEKLTCKEKAFVTVGAYCGLRTSEIMRLKADHYHSHENVIEVARSKKRILSRRLVPFPKRLSQLIDQLPFDKMTPRYITPIAREKKVWGQWPKNVLRHSCISYKVAFTGDLARVAIESGNSENKIIKNYRALRTVDGIPVTKKLAEEWFKVCESFSISAK